MSVTKEFAMYGIVVGKGDHIGVIHEESNVETLCRGIPINNVD